MEYRIQRNCLLYVVWFYVEVMDSSLTVATNYQQFEYHGEHVNVTVLTYSYKREITVHYLFGKHNARTIVFHHLQLYSTNCSSS